MFEMICTMTGQITKQCVARVCVGIAFLSLVACDAAERSTQYSLIENDAGVEAGADEEEARADRLRDLQAVEVILHTSSGNKLAQTSALSIYDEVVLHCSDKLAAVDGGACNSSSPVYSQCYSLCLASRNLCVAQTFLEAASSAHEPLKVNRSLTVGSTTGTSFTIPVQSIGARYDLANWAAGYARTANGSALTGITSCPAASLSLVVAADTVASRLASSAVDAYQLSQETANLWSDLSASLGDVQRSWTSSVETGTRWAVADQNFSRAAAAHLLAGGSPGLPTPTGAFCTVPELSAQAQRALTVLREAAPDPNAILAIPGTTYVSSSIELNTLLDDKASAVPCGSVRQRLARARNKPNLMAAEACTLPSTSSPCSLPLPEYFGLGYDDFAEARRFMAEEILSFSRSRTARLGSESCTPAAGAAYPKFAATANPPTKLPDVHYMTLTQARSGFGAAHYNDWQVSASNMPKSLPTMSGFAGENDQQLFNMRRLSLTLSALPAAVRDSVHDTLALTLSQGARDFPYRVIVGRFTHTVPVNHVVTRVWVPGATPTDGLRIVVGEDGLRCAVDGTVEGMDCTSTFEPVAGTFPSSLTAVALTSSLTLTGYDFPSAAWGEFKAAVPAQSPIVDGTRLYVVRPKTPGTPLPGPGGWEALAGFVHRSTELPAYNATTQLYDADVYQVAPQIAERVAELLRPSREWCSQSDVTCGGTRFDERLPLENELTQDQVDVESSWRHYLELARQAAAEADVLGEEHLRAALEADQRVESLSLREEEKRRLAEAEAETVQEICGTSFPIDELLKVFGSGLEQTGAGTCTSDTNCSAPTPMCVAGRCIAKVDAVMGPNYDRLLSCLGSSVSRAFVTPGDKELCLFTPAALENRPCQYPDPDAANPPCPVLRKPDMTCEQTLGGSIPMGANVHKVEALSFFATPGPTPELYKACDALRALRTGANPEQLANLSSTNFFNIGNLEALGEKLGWRAYTHSGSAITFDGREYYSTYGGANWPCGTMSNLPVSTRASCTSMPALPGRIDGPRAGFMCNVINCDSEEQRAAWSERAAWAVIAARSMTTAREPYEYQGDRSIGSPKALRGVFLPFRVSSEINAEHGYSELGRTQYPLGGHSILLRSFASDSSITGRNFGATDVNPPEPQWMELYNLLPPPGGSVNAIFDRAWVNADGQVEPFSDEETTFAIGDIGWLSRSGADPSEWWHLLSDTELLGIDPIPFSTSGAHARWLRDYLERKRTQPPPEELLWADGSILRAEHQNLIPEKVSSVLTVPDDDARTVAVLDAAELLCHFGLETQSTVGLEPPEINSVADLDKAGAFMHSLAESITSHATRLVFANFPQAAASALERGSAFGAYPGNGGSHGEAIQILRAQLVRLSHLLPEIAKQVDYLGSDMRALKVEVERLQTAKKINVDLARVDLLRDRYAQMSSCRNSLLGGVTGLVLGDLGAPITAAATCLDAVAHAGFASDQFRIIEEGQEELAGLDARLATLSFQSKFQTRADALAGHAAELRVIAEEVDGQLARLESLRNRARRAVERGVFLASTQAAKQAEISAAMMGRREVLRVRYERAHRNAVKMAFLAKRAIELRLGVRLSSMTEDLPLVEAPARWDAEICATTGVDYERLVDLGKMTLESSSGATSLALGEFADQYVGNYVRNLENVVESYVLVNNFHEGRDMATISLRDDVHMSRAECDVDSGNLLFHSDGIDQFEIPGERPGWRLENCQTEVVEGVEQFLPHCISTFSLGMEIEDASGVKLAADGALLMFGVNGEPCATECGLTEDSALAQDVDLEPGYYTISWYGMKDAPEIDTVVLPNSVYVVDEDGDRLTEPVEPTSDSFMIDGPTWNRYYRTFRIVTPERVTVRIVNAPAPTLPASTPRSLAAFQLEKVDPASPMPMPYVATTSTREVRQAVCDDTDGSAFRASAWRTGEAILCTDGYTDFCPANRKQRARYWETSFSLNLRDIEAREQLVHSGFARGNFNYRIESLGVNVVGTGTRNCESSASPAACHAAAFIPYSLSHDGPYFVRNHAGEDFRARLFSGHIEHARALAAERYVTNPLSSTDQALVSPYLRYELSGRPLDGNYTLRIWDEPGVNFAAIEDIQVVLNYRYWTRFN